VSVKVVIVDIESIRQPESPIRADAIIETLANSIVSLRGLLRLPILYSLGIDEYELLSGHAEYYAYLKACSFDDSLPDRITALVVNKEHEKEINQQLSSISSATGISETNALKVSTCNAEFNNLDAKLERMFNSQDKSINNLQNALLLKMEEFRPKPLPILEAFNNPVNTSQQISSNLAFLGKSKINKILKILHSMSEKGKPFSSLKNVQELLIEKQKNGRRVKLINDKNMIEIVDSWH
jgi:hypothetical protein